MTGIMYIIAPPFLRDMLTMIWGCLFLNTLFSYIIPFFQQQWIYLELLGLGIAYLWIQLYAIYTEDYSSNVIHFLLMGITIKKLSSK